MNARPAHLSLTSLPPLLDPTVTSPIYLDHNATTPLLPEVVEARLPYLREHFGAPHTGLGW